MADILCFISGINNRDTALTENGPSGVFPEGPSKLSTKCRQLERQKWELPKKFPFWQGLNGRVAKCETSAKTLVVS